MKRGNGCCILKTPFSSQGYPHDKKISTRSCFGSQVYNSLVERLRINGDREVTVKELYRDSDGVEWLVPRSSNPAFQTPIRADQQEPDIVEVRVIGVVVGSYRTE